MAPMNWSIFQQRHTKSRSSAQHFSFQSKTILYGMNSTPRLEWMVNQRIIEIMIEYGLKFGLNIDILLDETYNSDEYNQISLKINNFNQSTRVKDSID